MQSRREAVEKTLRDAAAEVRVEDNEAVRGRDIFAHAVEDARRSRRRTPSPETLARRERRLQRAEEERKQLEEDRRARQALQQQAREERRRRMRMNQNLSGDSEAKVDASEEKSAKFKPFLSTSGQMVRAPTPPPQVRPGSREERVAEIAVGPKLRRQLSDEGRTLLVGALTEPAHAFKCPITMDIMEDPVILADGHTYEREAIEAWLKGHATVSPFPRSSSVSPLCAYQRACDIKIR